MSSEQFENDEVSMVDVLEEDKELEAEANAVFGDSDDQHCTYDKVSLLFVVVLVAAKYVCIGPLLMLL